MMAVTETPTEDTQAVHNKTTVRRFVLDYLLVGMLQIKMTFRFTLRPVCR